MISEINIPINNNILVKPWIRKSAFSEVAFLEFPTWIKLYAEPTNRMLIIKNKYNTPLTVNSFQTRFGGKKKR